MTEEWWCVLGVGLPFAINDRKECVSAMCATLYVCRLGHTSNSHAETEHTHIVLGLRQAAGNYLSLAHNISQCATCFMMNKGERGMEIISKLKEGGGVVRDTHTHTRGTHSRGNHVLCWSSHSIDGPQSQSKHIRICYTLIKPPTTHLNWNGLLLLNKHIYR